MRPDPLLLAILSELFVNLSAGWFGAAFIVPISSGKIFPIKLDLLTADIIFGIVCLVIAFKVRKIGVKQ